MKNLVCAPPSETPGKVYIESVDDLGVEFRVELRLGLQEFSLELGGERQIDHHINRMLAFFLADLPERLADIFFKLRLVLDP